MIVITVVYASSRVFARSSTMSRTVAERRFQRRTMTSASSGPRNFSSAFSGLRRRRRSGRLTSRLSRSPAADGNAPAPQQTRVPFGQGLAPVGERDMKLDDEVPIPRLVDRAARAFSPLDHPGERERGEFALGVTLVDAGPAGPHEGPSEEDPGAARSGPGTPASLLVRCGRTGGETLFGWWCAAAGNGVQAHGGHDEGRAAEHPYGHWLAQPKSSDQDGL